MVAYNMSESRSLVGISIFTKIVPIEQNSDGVTNRRPGNGPIRIGHRTVAHVNCFVHSGWVRYNFQTFSAGDCTFPQPSQGNSANI